MSLRWKIVLLCAATMAAVVATLSGAFVVQTRGVVERTLRAQAATVSRELSHGLSAEITAAEAPLLLGPAENVVRSVPGIAYVVYRDAQGKAVAVARGDELPPDVAEQAGAARLEAGAATAHRVVQLGRMLVLEVAERVQTTGPGSGYVQVGVRADAIASEISDATIRSAGLALLCLLACLLVAYFVAGFASRPLARLSRVAADVARGDLRQEVSVRGNDEIGYLAGSFQAMSTGLREMALDLQRAASEIEVESGQILATATQQAASSAQQATAINETSTTMTEIAQTARQATEHADKVIAVAQRSEELSQDGLRSVQQATEGIESVAEQVKAIAASIMKLSERTLQIGEIIATVKDVAEQTNILALNAAIEASKAGEHGRGFAVVATEMRNLAEQSKAAATQVRAILGEIQAGTRAAVDATEEGTSRARAALGLAHTAGEAITGLAEVIRESSLAARQIANNTRQQTIGVDQIVTAIADLSGAMNDSVEGTRHIEKVSVNLTTVSKRLSDLLTRYQV